MEGGIPTPSHRELREMVADQMIHTTERVIPHMSEKIEVKLTTPPFTYEGFILNAAGTTIGWSKHAREAFSPFIRSFLDFRTPVSNLYQWATGPSVPEASPGG